MATNLVSLVMTFLTPEMIGRIASALGLDRNDTSTAVNAGVPAVLAALVGAAAKPGGPQKIADAAKQEMGTLDKFASMLGGTGASTVTDRGSNMLASLLGDRDQSALANSIGKFGTGIGRGRFCTRDVDASRYGGNRTAARLPRAGCRQYYQSARQPEGQYSCGDSLGLRSIAWRDRFARFARRYRKKSGHGGRRDDAGRGCFSRANSR